MARKIVMTLAMSLDGFIASDDGSFNWIQGDGNSSLNTENLWSYEKFLGNVDVVVMGKRCYEQDLHKDFKDKKIYVATSEKLEDYENISFIGGNIVGIINDEKINVDGKDIFLFGGGVLVDNFIKENAIDEYIIGIIPIILGVGRPFFQGNNPEIKLKMNSYSIQDGIAILSYSKRKP